MTGHPAAPRFHTPDSTPPSEALSRAFIWLKRRIEETERSGLLLVPDAAFIDGVLRPALGPPLVDLMKEEGGLYLGDGIQIILTEMKDLPDRRWDGPIAACRPSTADLDRIDALESVSMVLVVPGDTAAAEVWARRWGASPPPDEAYPYFNPRRS